jgi:NTP pyrophosphatase (non-canonical NTP hydrolase)
MGVIYIYMRRDVKVGDTVAILGGDYYGRIGKLTYKGTGGGCKVYLDEPLESGIVEVDVWDFNLVPWEDSDEDKESAKGIGIPGDSMKDAIKAAEKLAEVAQKAAETKKEDTEEKEDPVYALRIEDKIRKQVQKGRKKYGVTLDQNTSLTTEQRIEHLEEELIDGLMYCEHLAEAVGDPGWTANDYQRAALRTAQTDKYSPDDLLQNGVMGLCGEAGEVIDLVKKCMFQGHELDKEKIKQELGDCTWYISVAAYALGFSLSDIMEANISKLKERYPGGFSKERSINRKEYKTEGRDSEKVSTDIPGEGTQEAGPVRNND